LQLHHIRAYAVRENEPKINCVTPTYVFPLCAELSTFLLHNFSQSPKILSLDIIGINRQARNTCPGGRCQGERQELSKIAKKTALAPLATWRFKICLLPMKSFVPRSLDQPLILH
ncbi:MAG: hypothetical protein AB8I58_05670, partial [Anaerolineales bacterium]